MTDAAPETTDRPLTQDGPPLRLCLIDASAYIFRAYHALPPLTRKSDGLPVGAVQGYCNMLWKLLKDMKGADGPTHLAAIFDHSEKTFRNDPVRPVQGQPLRPARGPDPPVPAGARGDRGVRRPLRRTARLRGRRPDRHLCLQGARRGRRGGDRRPPTRT